MSDKPFILKCIEGDALLTDIDDFIDEWHEIEPQTGTLHDFLGMTWEEYSLWVADPDVLPHVVTAHKEDVPLGELLD